MDISECSKAKLQEAWTEILEKLKFEFSTLQLSVKGLQKKWSNIKDAWLKCHRKMLIAPVKPYVYYHLMEFMEPLYDSSKPVDSFPDEGDDSDEEETGKNDPLYLGKRHETNTSLKFHMLQLKNLMNTFIILHTKEFKIAFKIRNL
jgi:Alcohol dehydrogenase transcription factor Myb/SANT-like